MSHGYQMVRGHCHIENIPKDFNVRRISRLKLA
jgi:hypothetical protein